MEFLFDYLGIHIASKIDDRLYSRRGKHIGRYIPSSEIFVDLNGDYVGHVPFVYRLLHSEIYSFEGISFGSMESCGNIGDIGHIGEIGLLEKVEGFKDISKSKLE